MPFWMRPGALAGSGGAVLRVGVGALDPGHSRVLQPTTERDKKKKERKGRARILDHSTTTSAIAGNYNGDGEPQQSFFAVFAWNFAVRMLSRVAGTQETTVCVVTIRGELAPPLLPQPSPPVVRLPE